MESNIINISVEQFRAINKANISINGITVVAGENGCGKSSISKLLYFLLRTAVDYDGIIKKKLSNKLRDIFLFMRILEQDIHMISNRTGIESEYIRRSRSLRYKTRIDSLENSQEQILEVIESLTSAIKNIESTHSRNTDEFLKGNKMRYFRIIEDIVGKQQLGDFENVSLVDALSKIKVYVDKLYVRSREKLKVRPTSLFKDELNDIFSDSLLPKEFSIREFDREIVSFKKESLQLPYIIQEAIYIDNDNPIIRHSNSKDLEHREYLINLLNRKSAKSIKTKGQKRLASKIDTIIDGKAYLSDDLFSGNFKYERNDGSIFELSDVASGIKSFSILQLLLNNGALDDKTLLIIDEPESNLHPQWIVEYARLIVLIHRYVGVKFFLASHNPDMVSAIRYISEKEGVLDNVNFYLAKKVPEQYTYDYLLLEKDIDPIFNSFNIAIDKLNEYGI